jgi:pyruvate kinase
MQKYIAVVNPSMDEDEISHLITKGVAGALFAISHGNYPGAARMIGQIQELSRKHGRPVSIIQDVSDMENPMDLDFGKRLGAHFVATDKPEHVKLIRGLNKLASVIYKGRQLPKGLRVDSVMDKNFIDPDAEIMGHSKGIKHLLTEHPNQALLDSILHIGHHADTHSVAVSDLGLAQALSYRRPNKKIIFAPDDESQAARGALYWGVHPVFHNGDLMQSLRTLKLTKKGQKLVDARDIKHVNIIST